MARPTPQTPPRLFGWRTVVVCVVVGVVVNVGVAWGLAAWAQMSETRYATTASSRGALDWPSDGLTHRAQRPGAMRSFRSAWWLGQTKTWWYDEDWSVEDPALIAVVEERSGLPLPTMVGYGEWWAADHSGGRTRPQTAWLARFRRSQDPLDAFRLPLRPILPGFFVNTLAYGGLAFALVLLARVVRRRRRVRRGCCIACGYDVRGVGVCPECGMAIGG